MNQWGYTDIHLTCNQPMQGINSIRSNKDFDFVGSPLRKSPLNKTDYDSFEPRDAVRVICSFDFLPHGRTL
ncbi:hypothetical protein O9929_16015 [Vibrio lentus]|nr:hypothetical protein [Vibrio lentus]